MANRNAPGQVVVSGERAAIEAGAEIAQGRSARSGRSSCRSASRRTRRSWPRPPKGCARRSAGIDFQDPTTTLLANADGRPITTADAARAELVEHLTAGVDWVGAVERMADAGVTTFVEVGPGKVLTGLIKRIAPDAEIVPADDPATHDRLIDLAAVAA